LLIFGYGLEFFTKTLYVIDFIIVTTSLLLDLLIPEDQAVGLLVVLRLWRITRIAHGLFVYEVRDEIFFW